MFYLNYEDVLKKFSALGYMTQLNQIKGKEIIIRADSKLLSKIGLVAGENELLIAYKDNDFVFYEINLETNLGYGEESVIYKGKNLKTQETIARKGALHFPHHSTNSMDGWKLAKEKLEFYPYFVKTYALGQVCELSSEALENNNIQCRNAAYQLMEEIISPLESCFLSYRAKNWDKKQIKQFMLHITNAFEAFPKERIFGFDSGCGNILVDQNNIPKLCDFSELKMSANDVQYSGHYYLAIQFFYQMYYDSTHCYRYKSQLAKDTCETTASYLKTLLDWISQNNISSREETNSKIDEAIDYFEQQKCAIQCLEKAFTYKETEDINLCRKNCSKTEQEILVQGEVLDAIHPQSHMRRLLSLQLSEDTPKTNSGNKLKPSVLEIAIIMKNTGLSVLVEMSQIAKDIVPIITPVITWQNVLAIAYGSREILGPFLSHRLLALISKENATKMRSWKRKIDKLSQNDGVKLSCDLSEFAVRSNMSKTAALLEFATHETVALTKKPKRKFIDVIRFTLLMFERMGSNFIQISSLFDLWNKSYIAYRNRYAENGFRKIPAFYSGLNAAIDNIIRLIPGARIIADNLDRCDENESLFDGPWCSETDLEKRNMLLSNLNEKVKSLSTIEKLMQKYLIKSREEITETRSLLFKQKEELRAIKQKHIECRLTEAQTYDFDLSTLNIGPTDKSSKHSCVIL